MQRICDWFGIEISMKSKNIVYIYLSFSPQSLPRYSPRSPNIWCLVSHLPLNSAKMLCILEMFIWTPSLIDPILSLRRFWKDSYYINKRSLFWTCWIVSSVNLCTSIGKRTFSTLGTHFGASSMPLLNRISRSVSECFVIRAFILDY